MTVELHVDDNLLFEKWGCEDNVGETLCVSLSVKHCVFRLAFRQYFSDCRPHTINISYEKLLKNIYF